MAPVNRRTELGGDAANDGVGPSPATLEAISMPVRTGQPSSSAELVWKAAASRVSSEKKWPTPRPGGKPPFAFALAGKAGWAISRTLPAMKLIARKVHVRKYGGRTHRRTAEKLAR